MTKLEKELSNLHENFKAGFIGYINKVIKAIASPSELPDTFMLPFMYSNEILESEDPVSDNIDKALQNVRYINKVIKQAYSSEQNDVLLALGEFIKDVNESDDKNTKSQIFEALADSKTNKITMTS